MKRKTSILLALALILSLFAGCKTTGEVEVREIQAYRLLRASTVDELRSVSDLIVVFTPENQENVLYYFDDGVVATGHTRTSGVVSEVLKGDVSAGDTIVITEECYTTEDGSVLWTQQGYLPMQDGKRYLLFLTRYSEKRTVFAGMYYPTELEYGKYLLREDGGTETMTNGMGTADDFEIGPYGDLEKYSSWYGQVAALYPELF